MHSRLRPSPAMVIALIALFVSLGGTAAALSGSNTVFSDDIVDNQVFSADVRNDTLAGGGLGAADLKPSSVGTSEVAANSLNGGDINESGLGTVPNANQLDGIDSTAFLDRCPAGTSEFGRICAGSDGQARSWLGAIGYCSGLGLRLASFSEAVTLSQNHDVPGVGPVPEEYWTDNYFGDGSDRVLTANEAGGGISRDGTSVALETVCVTDPSN